MAKDEVEAVEVEEEVVEKRQMIKRRKIMSYTMVLVSKKEKLYLVYATYMPLSMILSSM